MLRNIYNLAGNAFKHGLGNLTGMNAGIEGASAALGRASGLTKWQGLKTAASGFASGWSQSLPGRVGQIGGSALSFAGSAIMKHPGKTVAAGILGTTAYSLFTEPSRVQRSGTFKDRSFDIGDRTPIPIRTSFTDQAFRNSAAGLTFGLHRSRHR